MTLEQTQHSLVFIGSYAEPADPGVYVFSLNGATGALTLLDEAVGLKNPSFLDIDHEHHRIYAIHQRQEDGEQQPSGYATAYAFDPQSGRLTRLNEERTVARPTCHIQYQDQAGHRYVIVSSYHGGYVGIAPVLADGTIGPMNDIHQHAGPLGPHTARQDKPHPHSAFVDPEQRYVYVPDLGLDCVRIYELDSRQPALRPIGEASSAPGAGPRHLTFHPQQPYVYVINELDSTITLYARDHQNGMLESLQTVSTLPSSFQGENTCAEIHISRDGRFVYGSNRGHDSIAVFAVDEGSGQLTPVEIVSSGGEIPRNFALSPDGRYLVAAHQESGNLVVFRVDQASGRLQDTGQRADADGGVCVKFWQRARIQP